MLVILNLRVCVTYTSGSTCTPKGVVIAHANLIASIDAVKELLGHHLKQDNDFLMYLPLAHILKYIVEPIIPLVDIPTGYGHVRTLTGTSVHNCKGSVACFKPSILIGIP